MAAAVWALRVVFVDQQAAGNVAWMARSPSLEDLGWANVDVLLGVDCLPLLEWGRGHMNGFDEEDCDYVFASASRSLEFHRQALTGEKPDIRLLLGFRIISVHKSLVTCDDVPDPL